MDVKSLDSIDENLNAETGINKEDNVNGEDIEIIDIKQEDLDSDEAENGNAIENHSSYSINDTNFVENYQKFNNFNDNHLESSWNNGDESTSDSSSETDESLVDEGEKDRLLVLWGIHDTFAQKVPEGLILKYLNHHLHSSIFTIKEFPKGSVFGPYGGKVVVNEEGDDDSFCWNVYSEDDLFLHRISSKQSERSNWMRYINHPTCNTSNNHTTFPNFPNNLSINIDNNNTTYSNNNSNNIFLNTENNPTLCETKTPTSICVTTTFENNNYISNISFKNTYPLDSFPKINSTTMSNQHLLPPNDSILNSNNNAISFNNNTTSFKNNTKLPYNINNNKTPLYNNNNNNHPLPFTNATSLLHNNTNNETSIENKSISPSLKTAPAPHIDSMKEENTGNWTTTSIKTEPSSPPYHPIQSSFTTITTTNDHATATNSLQDTTNYTTAATTNLNTATSNYTIETTTNFNTLTTTSNSNSINSTTPTTTSNITTPTTTTDITTSDIATPTTTEITTKSPNLEAFQQHHQIYYIATEDIPACSELVVQSSIVYNRDRPENHTYRIDLSSALSGGEGSMNKRTNLSYDCEDIRDSSENSSHQYRKSDANIVKKIKNDNAKKRRKNSIDSLQTTSKRNNGGANANKTEKRFKCDTCAYQTDVKASLVCHKRTHTGEKPFACSICNATFSHNSHMQRHKRTHTGHKPHKCDVCQADFTRSGALAEHKLVHEEGDASNLRSLKPPPLVRNGTAERPYKCELCETTFKRSDGLRDHIRIHTGEKPYKCELCNAAFAQSGALSVHRLSHNPHKPFKCVVCDRFFSRVSALREHKRTHEDHKIHKCETCGLVFARNGTLKRHVRTHTGEKPYTCEVCYAAFARRSTLLRHGRTHTGERPYKCEYCGDSFAQCSNLKHHVRVRHLKYMV